MLIFCFYLFPTYEAKINKLAGQEVISLDTRLSYVKTDVEELFETIGKEGRECRAFVSGVMDMIYPLIYGSLFFLLLSKLTNTYHNRLLKWCPFLAIIAVIFDYSENFGILYLLDNYSIITESQVIINSFFTGMKWGFVGLTLLAVFSLTFLKFKNNIIKK